MRDRSLSSTCPDLTAQPMQLKPHSAVDFLLIRSLQPFSPFDGTGLRLRSRIGHMARPLRHSWLLPPSVSLFSRTRILRDAVTMDTFRSGKRGRLKIAPFEATTADAGGQGLREGDRERKRGCMVL